MFRIAASPVMVAVALGLLNPVALDDEDESVRLPDEAPANGQVEPASDSSDLA